MKENKLFTVKLRTTEEFLADRKTDKNLAKLLPSDQFEQQMLAELDCLELIELIFEFQTEKEAFCKYVRPIVIKLFKSPAVVLATRSLVSYCFFGKDEYLNQINSPLVDKYTVRATDYLHKLYYEGSQHLEGLNSVLPFMHAVFLSFFASSNTSPQKTFEKAVHAWAHQYFIEFCYTPIRYIISEFTEVDFLTGTPNDKSLLVQSLSA